MTSDFAVLNHSLKVFPVDAQAKNACGLPFGSSLMPFGRLPTLVDEKNEPVASNVYDTPLPVESIGRCANCGGYVNPFVTFEAEHWLCSICLHRNAMHADSRYRNRSTSNLPELQMQSIEYELEKDSQHSASSTPLNEAPLHIAIVDMSGGSAYVESVQQSLNAMLEALPRAARFALITYSDKIGIYNLHCRVPHVALMAVNEHDADAADIQQTIRSAISSTTSSSLSSSMAAGNKPTALSLAELLPFIVALAPIEKCESEISVAIGALAKSALMHSTQRRATGAVIRAVNDFIETASNQPLNVVVTLFTSGSPNFGIGSAKFSEKSTVDSRYDDDGSFLRPVTRFYRVQAERAARRGTTINLICCNSASMQLPSLKFLTMFTGGSLFVYASNQLGEMSRDIDRCIATARAYHCVLRVRTGRDFRVATLFGNVLSARDDDVDGDVDGFAAGVSTAIASGNASGSSSSSSSSIYLMQSCRPSDTLALDFAFANPHGFNSHNSTTTIQIAFAYSTRIGDAEQRDTDDADDQTQPSSSSSSSSSTTSSTTTTSGVRQRLRVWTVRPDFTDSTIALMANADADVVSQLLAAKAARVAFDTGLAASRHLLRDWLLVLLAYYNEARARIEQHDIGVDVAFMQCESLKPIPRMVFALSRSSLLFGDSRDQITLAQQQAMAMSASVLSCFLYARLAAYSTPQKLMSPATRLSAAAVHAISSSARHADCDNTIQFRNSPRTVRILVFDRHVALVVYYTALACAEQLPFPPAKDTAVRQWIANARRVRPIVPTVTYLRADVDADERVFRSLLIEEPINCAPNASNDIRAICCSFTQFVDSLATDVSKLSHPPQ